MPRPVYSEDSPGRNTLQIHSFKSLMLASVDRCCCLPSVCSSVQAELMAGRMASQQHLRQYHLIPLKNEWIAQQGNHID